MVIGFSPGVGYFPTPSRVVLSHSSPETSSIQVSVYPLFVTQTVIEWSIPASWGNCTFNIYESPYELEESNKLNSTPLSNTNIFVNTNMTDSSKFRDHQYVVECRMPDGRYVRSPSTTWQNTRSGFVEIRAKEIQRREMILLKKFVGVKSLIFRRKTFGKRCSACWDPALEKVTKDNCKVCLGTSFEGGYFAGYPTFIQYDPTSNPSEYGPQGVVEPNVIPAWTTSMPNIHTFDLVLRVPDMKLYRAEAIQTTELQTVAVRQMLQLTELGKFSIEMELAKQSLPASLASVI